MFEGVSPSDNAYQLMYSGGFLVLIYPNQMLCLYQDNSFFVDQENPKFPSNSIFDPKLAFEGDKPFQITKRLALRHVVQSLVPLDLCHFGLSKLEDFEEPVPHLTIIGQIK